MVGFRVWRAFPTVGTQAVEGGIVIRWRVFPRQGVRAWMRGCVGVGAGQRGRTVESKSAGAGQTESGGEGHLIYRQIKGQRGIQLPRHEIAWQSSV
jgi:hypothetical protein